MDNSCIGFPEHMDPGRAIGRQATNFHILVLKKKKKIHFKRKANQFPVANKRIQNHEVYVVFLPLLGIIKQ